MTGYMLIARKSDYRNTNVLPHDGRGVLVTNDEFEATEDGRRMAMKNFMSHVENIAFQPYDANVWLYAPDCTEIAVARFSGCDRCGYVVTMLPDGYIEVMDTTSEESVKNMREWAQDEGATFHFVKNPSVEEDE